MNKLTFDKILVVDDNPPMRKALVETLKHLQYDAIEAGNGIEALEKIERLQSDHSGRESSNIVLIISDLTMPVMDGRELLIELKKRNIGLPFVMLSGYLTNNALDDLKEKGLSGWLQKPADIDQISNLLHKILK
jgi:two-component system response regulator FlrC